MKDKRGIKLAVGQTVITNRPAGGFGKVVMSYGIVVNITKKMVRIEDEVEGNEFNKYPDTVFVVELPTK